MAAPYLWQDLLVRRGWLQILSHAELVVLWAYCTSVNVRSRETWLAADRVAEFTGLAPSTVYDGLNRLSKHGLLQTERREKTSQFARRSYFRDVHTLCSAENIPVAPAQRTFRKSGTSLPPDIPKPRTVVNGAYSEDSDRGWTPESNENPSPIAEIECPIREVRTNTNFPDQGSTVEQGSSTKQGRDQGSTLNGQHKSAQAHLEEIVGEVFSSQDLLSESALNQLAQALVRAGPARGWTSEDVRKTIERARREVGG